jgi:hypothetical protein
MTAPKIKEGWHQVPYIFPEDKPENKILDQIIINFQKNIANAEKL